VLGISPARLPEVIAWMPARQRPEAAALARWAAEVLDSQPEPVAAEPIPAAGSLSTDLVIDLAIGGCECVVCGSRHAIPRPQLPLKSMVCDQCWPVIAAELGADTGGVDEGAAA
jgi:hypothetical protein